MPDLSTTILLEKKQTYKDIFTKLQPIDGKLSGAKARQVLIKSELPIDTLRQVWTLSDIDRDGCLDLEEFILAMHLIYECMDGVILPQTLPFALIPASKNKSDTTMLALMPPQQENGNESDLPLAICSHPTSIDKIATPTVTEIHKIAQEPKFPEWCITPEELAVSDKLFSSLDTDANGLLSGLQVKDIFMKSGLHHQILASIWDLVDYQGTGFLNHEQFAVAYRLLNSQIPGPGEFKKPLPSSLSYELLPPSLRPVRLDTSHFQESNSLIEQLERMKKEKQSLENDCYQLDINAHVRANEMTQMTRTTDTLQQTNDSLEKQREMAETFLNNLYERKTQMESQLSEIQVKINEEKTLVDELRSKVTTQYESVKSQENQLNALRQELNELMREENQLQEKFQQQRLRLDAVEKENELYRDKIENAKYRISKLNECQSELDNMLSNYDNLNSVSTNFKMDVQKLLNSSKQTLDSSKIESKTSTFSKKNEISSLSVPIPFSKSVLDFDPFPSQTCNKIVSNNPDAFSQSSTTSNSFYHTSWDDPFSPPEINKAFAPQTSSIRGVSDTSVSSFNDPFSLNLTNDSNAFGQSNQKSLFTTSEVDKAFGQNDNNSNEASNDPWSSNLTLSSTNPTTLISSPTRSTNIPPPRPSKQPGQGREESFKSKSRPLNHSKSKKSSKISTPTSLSEDQQLKWAEEESLRQARLDDENRKQEEEDLRLAIKLSQRTN